MKIAIFNVKYSPNLGDGVIAECLESELMRRIPGSVVKSIDLAGRNEWPVPTSGHRRVTQFAILRRSPRWFGNIMVETALRFRLWRRVRPAWRRELTTVDVAVFGGGNLIQDADLNFPLKLAAAAAECRSRGIPMAVYAIGAAASRSPRGERLLSALLRSPALSFAAARDEASAAALRARGVGNVKITRDPALLAARLWPAGRHVQHVRPLVGLCITHPAVLRHHGFTSDERCGAVDKLYRQLAEELLRAGYDVVCFSNGADEDEALVAEIGSELSRAHVDATGTRVRIAARCRRPSALAALVAGFDAVIAHRLHACILAYSYRVPHVGLTWDPKVASLFAELDRRDYAVPLSCSTVSKIPDLVRRAQKEGIPEETHARILDETSAAVHHLAVALVSPLGRGRLRMRSRSSACASGQP